MSATALLGLIIALGQGALLWAVMLGVGSGTFPLVLTLFSLRTRTLEATAAVSAFAQGGGYLLAAAGPFAVGALREASGGWAMPLGVVLVLMVVQGFSGLIAGRDEELG